MPADRSYRGYVMEIRVDPKDVPGTWQGVGTATHPELPGKWARISTGGMYESAHAAELDVERRLRLAVDQMEDSDGRSA